MYKHFLKKVLALARAILITILSGSFSAADIKIPDKVRIGLYYTDSSAGVKNAVSTLNVSAPMGIQLGYDLNGSFNVLYEETSSSNITIRKDSYYIRVNNTFSETTANASNGGAVLGPYHIKIGGEYSNLNSVKQKISELQQQGITAFPVYVDSWQTWTGCFSNVNSAQTDLKSNLQTKLPKEAHLLQSYRCRKISLFQGFPYICCCCLFSEHKVYFQVSDESESMLYRFRISMLFLRCF
ncbi:MAG TPA: hypothetical protein VHT34_11660, partial [Clostridia bacterium]|nr:hypothetical protein [Clostridia bacterium]